MTSKCISSEMLCYENSYIKITTTVILHYDSTYNNEKKQLLIYKMRPRNYYNNIIKQFDVNK